MTGVGIFADMIKIRARFIQKPSKIQEKLKESEIMYQNSIYICVSWYNKICQFSLKIWWCQQKPGGVPHDLYIFWIFF